VSLPWPSNTLMPATTRGGPFGRPGGVNAVTANGYLPLIKAALDMRFSGGESRRSDIWLDRVGRCS
jgi:hypothetical protein